MTAIECQCVWVVSVLRNEPKGCCVQLSNLLRRTIVKYLDKFPTIMSQGPSHRPYLSKPYIVGYMSVDHVREYHSDLSQLKFLNSIPRGTISLDLNHNIDKAVKRTTDDNDEKINLLLKFLLDQNKQLSDVWPDVEWVFITYRRTLISVMCSAYGAEPIRIVATLFDGAIYLCSLETPQQEQKRRSRNNQEAKFCAWGYKFEQYLLSDLPTLQPDIQKPVIENEEFSLYYRATLGRHELFYGAQIDGLLATGEMKMNPETIPNVDKNLEYLRNNSYLELKTNRLIHHRRQEESFKKYKLLRCWCQCYLANLQGLLVGYRNDDGIVQKLQWFSTAEIVRYCRNLWDPQTAVNFLDYFLTFAQQCFKNEVSKTYGNNYNSKNVGPITMQFDIDTNKLIEVTCVNEVILPEWYMQAKREINK